MTPTATERVYTYDNDATHAVDHHTALSMLLDEFTRDRITELVDLTGAGCAEVAAGGGTIAVWLAEQVGHDGSVLATDLKPRLIPQRERLSVKAHDITTGPVPGGPYDLVHCRLLLNHLPQRVEVAGNLVASLRPGGVLLTGDFLPRQVDDFVVRAASDEDADLLRRFHQAHADALTRHGNDRQWSRRAPDVYRQLGLRDVEMTELTGDWPAGSPGCHLLAAITTQIHDEVIQTSSLTGSDLARVRELLLDSDVVVGGHAFYSTSGRLPE
jgi:ubiquinone/menaquinone biosynthesis C-methylase UbiE